MLTCELCNCAILHPERGDCRSWYSVCEACLVALAPN